MQKPPFTIAIPLHGTCRYADEALRTALDQNDDHYKVLLIRDDDEDDSSLLSQRGNRQVIYLRNPARGIAANWNSCLDNASGALCTILHQDDRLVPSYIPRIRRLYEIFPEASAYFVGARVIGPSGAYRFSLPDALKSALMPRHEPIILQHESGLVALLRGNWIFCPTVCYNLTRSFPWRFNNSHKMVLDLDMYVQILLSGQMIVGTHEKHYLYRRHPLQQTARLERDLARFEEEITYYRSLALQFKQRTYRSAAKIVSCHWVLRGHALLKAVSLLAHCDIRAGLRLARCALS